MNKLIQLLLILLFFVSCENQPINYEELLVERNGIYVTKGDNLPYSGSVFSLDRNGKIKEEGKLKKGRFFRKTIFEYHNNGQTKLKGNIENSRKHGLWQAWYENGDNSYRGTYKNGIKNGEWTYWKSGSVFDPDRYREHISKNSNKNNDIFFPYEKKRIRNYKDGKITGKQTGWMDGGQKLYEQFMREGL